MRNAQLDNENNAGVTPELPSVRSARVAKNMAIFNTIVVSYEPQNELEAAFDEVRLTALETRINRVATGLPLLMPVMRTIAEMGVGKTWGAQKLARRLNSSEPGAARRILVATLDTSGTQGSVPAAILVALGKHAPEHGKPPVLWRRANLALKEHGVEIVIFDEVNRAARRPTIGPVIGGDLMTFLTEGNVAVAFLGTVEADKLFDRAPALGDRLKSPVVMKALDWEYEESKGIYPDREIFLKFLTKMDEAMLAKGLIDRSADLAIESTAKLLWEVCRGRLRPLCLLLEEAVGSIARYGGPLIIDLRVLADAVESHSIPNKVINYNPFNGETPP